MYDVSVSTSDGLLVSSLFENVLQVKLAGFVAGSDQRPAGAVKKAHLVGFRLPKSELLRRHVLLHLQVPLRRLEREKGWGGEMGVEERECVNLVHRGGGIHKM